MNLLKNKKSKWKNILTRTAMHLHPHDLSQSDYYSPHIFLIYIMGMVAVHLSQACFASLTIYKCHSK